MILDGGAATDSAVLVLDDFVTVEWLEIRGGGSGFDGVEWQSIAAVNKGVARYLLIHNLNDNGIQIQDSSAIVDVYNNILYRNGGGLRNVSALSHGRAAHLQQHRLRKHVRRRDHRERDDALPDHAAQQRRARQRRWRRRLQHPEHPPRRAATTWRAT